MRKSIIVATDEASLIGAEGRLPWHLPEDLKLFRQLTMGKPVIMGRKTFESIGKPLPGRMNVVLSTRAGFALPGCSVAHSLDEAFSIAAKSGADECMVVGGGAVYAAAIWKADRLYVTQIKGAFDVKAQRDKVYFPQGWERRRTLTRAAPSVVHPVSVTNPHEWTAAVFDLGPVMPVDAPAPRWHFNTVGTPDLAPA